MEIVGIGTDIVECLRIGRMIERHGELFLTRVYTEREIRYCHSRKHATGHFAGHWAAKEAIRKCLGADWARGLAWTDLEIRLDRGGKPRLLVCGGAKDPLRQLGISDILISIAHCRAYAVGYALAVRNLSPPEPEAPKPP